MKRVVIGVMLAAAATLALAGCGSSGAQSASSGSSGAQSASSDFGDCKVTGTPGSMSLQTQKPGVLVVNTVLPNPGWWNGTNPESTKSGYEYCMAADIAYRAGLKSIELKNLAWDQYISGTAKAYDIGIATTTITPQRKQVFDFSTPYFSSGLGVIAKVGSKITAANIRQAKIGVLQGNAGSAWVHDVLKPTQTPQIYPDGPSYTAALAAGQVDAVINDTTLLLATVKASAGKLTVVGQYPSTKGDYGIVLPLHSQNTAQVDKALADMTSDGTFKALNAEYLEPMFGMDPNSVPAWTLPSGS